MTTLHRPAIFGLERMRMWLAEPQGAWELWLGRRCVMVAWLGLLLAVWSPPHGTGVSVCWLQSATGIPCLGCGLTRSLSCGIRGLIGESWDHHPMGILILALFAFTAAQSLLPARPRAALRAYIQARAIGFKFVYLGFVSVFIVYGAGRALLQCASI